VLQTLPNEVLALDAQASRDLLSRKPLTRTLGQKLEKPTLSRVGLDDRTMDELNGPLPLGVEPRDAGSA
jgi:hypothetical protein